MTYDVVIVGAGFGSLTAAALLTRQGLRVCVLEQAKYPGGCASTYKRKGYWFETGATTLVGLDAGMPLRYLLDQLELKLPVRRLHLPMQVHLPDGQLLTRYPQLDEWIAEAERVFGKHNQRAFWEHSYRVSQQVWRTSLQQVSFPLSSARDVWQAVRQFRPAQLRLVPAAFRTMHDVLRQYDLLQNKLFVGFVNEQLLITAQNYLLEVNEAFGATALCYTLYGNYYVPGGMLNMVQPIIGYMKAKGAEVKYGQTVTAILPADQGYETVTNKGTFKSRFVVSGLPLNNTLPLFQNERVRQKLQRYLMPSAKLNGAFTMGLALQQEAPDVLHHQVHVPEGLPITGSKSVFVSFSHRSDRLRAPAGHTVAAISTHIPDPAATLIAQEEKEALEQAIIRVLEKKGLLQPGQIVYRQGATPGAWQFWTHRAFGAVGGYPQYRHIKPWQMKDARLDHRGAYLCGDTVYPGQGIPGVCLSGIIAAHKLLHDHPDLRKHLSLRSPRRVSPWCAARRRPCHQLCRASILPCRSG